MNILERELADLIAQIKQIENKPDMPERASLIETKRRLCDLLAVLG